jgi:hypothetical protein
MSEALVEALRELLDSESDTGFYMKAVSGADLDLADWATRALAALAAYEAAPGPAVSAIREAFIQGFNASAQGFNAEFGATISDVEEMADEHVAAFAPLPSAQTGEAT